MAKNDIWTTKDGRKLKMCEMADSHLKNAINYFSSYGNVNIHVLQILKAEKSRRDKLIPDKPINSRFDILDI